MDLYTVAASQERRPDNSRRQIILEARMEILRLISSKLRGETNEHTIEVLDQMSDDIGRLPA